MKTFLICALFLSSSAIFAAQEEPLEVVMKNAQDVEIGKAKLSSLKEGVKILLDLKGLPPGPKAIHFHETGECDEPTFASAGEHFAPGSKVHGHKAKGGPHAGDMANVTVKSDGSLKTEVTNKHVTLAQNAQNSLLKDGGTALVIHAQPDDYKSQPAGNAGDRLACGEIND